MLNCQHKGYTILYQVPEKYIIPVLKCLYVEMIYITGFGIY